MSIGVQTVFTYVLIYSFGMLIGQDIWQRVFTARSDKVARSGGTVAGRYCLVYAIAGAVIGTATKVLYPKLDSPDAAFATIVGEALPIGVKGLVLAAALVGGHVHLLRRADRVRDGRQQRHLEAPAARCAAAPPPRQPPRRRTTRPTTRCAATACSSSSWAPRSSSSSIVLNDVVEALTVAYNLLVGGLLVPILGGLVWKRGTAAGALAAVAVGGVTVIGAHGVEGHPRQRADLLRPVGLAGHVRGGEPGQQADGPRGARQLAGTSGRRATGAPSDAPAGV